jgi:hydrogenase nickel incorporation protein HypA/HybF
MALCEGLVQALEEQALTQGFTRVHTVWLEIGALATVEPEALRFNFDIVTNGTLAAQARLEIIEVDGTAWCMNCAQTVHITRFGAGCPQCGSYQLQVTDGQQIKIKQLEVA